MGVIIRDMDVEGSIRSELDQIPHTGGEVPFVASQGELKSFYNRYGADTWRNVGFQERSLRDVVDLLKDQVKTGRDPYGDSRRYLFSLYTGAKTTLGEKITSGEILPGQIKFDGVSSSTEVIESQMADVIDTLKGNQGVNNSFEPQVLETILEAALGDMLSARRTTAESNEFSGPGLVHRAMAEIFVEHAMTARPQLPVIEGRSMQKKIRPDFLKKLPRFFPDPVRFTGGRKLGVAVAHLADPDYFAVHNLFLEDLREANRRSLANLEKIGYLRDGKLPPLPKIRKK